MKFLIYISLIIISIIVSAQTSKIEILNSDNTYANSNIHPNYWRLIGNVSFKHNNAIMQCDSAYHYINQNKIQAYGNIRIKQGDSITITGENLIYIASKRKINIKGNVQLIDKYMTLKTHQIFYNLDSKIASYPLTGTIIENDKIITSKKGAYNSQKYNFIFTDSVTVLGQNYNILTDTMHYRSDIKIVYFFGPSHITSKNKLIYCENGWHNTQTSISQFQDNAYIQTKNYTLKSDSIYYNMHLKYGKAIHNVEVIDTINNIRVLGGLGEYFEEENSIEVTIDPLLLILFENDTLFMHANKFVSIQRPEEEQILAYNQVKFFKKNFQGKCDSLDYKFNNSTINMFNNPILWNDVFQITADTIQLLTQEGKIHQIFLEPNPMIISKEDSIDYNQMKGKKMVAYFSENKIHKMDIEGNGQSIFIINDENKKIGLNFSECSNMKLYFKKNKLDIINYEVMPNSITTPYENLEKEDRFLKGFIWRGDEKPKNKEDIFIF